MVFEVRVEGRPEACPRGSGCRCRPAACGVAAPAVGAGGAGRVRAAVVCWSGSGPVVGGARRCQERCGWAGRGAQAFARVGFAGLDAFRSGRPAGGTFQPGGVDARFAGRQLVHGAGVGDLEQLGALLSSLQRPLQERPADDVIAGLGGFAVGVELRFDADTGEGQLRRAATILMVTVRTHRGRRGSGGQGGSRYHHTSWGARRPARCGRGRRRAARR